MRISDWRSDVCSSDLFQGQYLLRGRLDAGVAQHGLVGELHLGGGAGDTPAAGLQQRRAAELHVGALVERTGAGAAAVAEAQHLEARLQRRVAREPGVAAARPAEPCTRTEEPTAQIP